MVRRYLKSSSAFYSPPKNRKVPSGFYYIVKIPVELRWSGVVRNMISQFRTVNSEKSAGAAEICQSGPYEWQNIPAKQSTDTNRFLFPTSPPFSNLVFNDSSPENVRPHPADARMHTH